MEVWIPEWIKIVCGYTAVVLALWGLAFYVWDIWKGNTKPHLYTWTIWAVVTTIAFLGQWYGGAGVGSYNTGVSAAFCIGIALLAVWYGTKDVNWFDNVCLVLSFVAIVPWVLTGDALLSVVLATLIDVVAYAPTLRKTWHDPLSEYLLSAQVAWVRHIITIVALQAYSVETWFYPAALLLMQGVFVVEIMWRRKRVVIQHVCT